MRIAREFEARLTPSTVPDRRENRLEQFQVLDPSRGEGGCRLRDYCVGFCPWVRVSMTNQVAMFTGDVEVRAASAIGKPPVQAAPS